MRLSGDHCGGSRPCSSPVEARDGARRRIEQREPESLNDNFARSPRTDPCETMRLPSGDHAGIKSANSSSVSLRAVLAATSHT